MWDAVFGTQGNGNEARATFDADLAAYKYGNYMDKKQRFGNGEPSFDQILDQFSQRLTDAGGLPTPVVNKSTSKNVGGGTSYYGPVVTNMQTILTQLKTRLTNAINSGMNVDDILNTTNRARLTELNGYLLTQTGEDVEQLKATLQDITDIGYTTTITPVGQAVAMQTGKMSSLQGDFGPELLKPELKKEEEVKMA
jgi:hypothetical protein